jgi:cytosine/adenosine deaminase-related metal-dependent hydrolase
MILRARAVLPMSRPPIEDGAVQVAHTRIRAVGRWPDISADCSETVVDLGECLILPGLINAHCHLDCTALAGRLPVPETFLGWIQALLAAKAGMDQAEYAESWLRGAQMLVRTGTTTVANIEAVFELLPEVWQATPLRVISFLEMTGVKSQLPPPAILQQAIRKIRSLPRGRNSAGLAPHAPYSTRPELLRLSAQAARRHRWLLTIHVAESAAEFDLFRHKRGPLFDWLETQRDLSDCGHGSPVLHLESLGVLGARLLAAHVNYLDKGDAQRLSQQGVSVVHCPRSHACFRHRKFPRLELAKAGINLCLGTDSLASVRLRRGETLELDMFAEMRALASHSPGLSAAEVLRMTTINGAQALHRQGELGELSEGAWADLIAVPFAGRRAEIHEAVIHHSGDVTASMIDGRWAIKPGA